jgi:hypothetical protein
MHQSIDTVSKLRFLKQKAEEKIFLTRAGLKMERKGFDRELLLRRALITPSCGAGGVLTEPLAERGLSLLHQLSRTLRSRFGFA